MDKGDFRIEILAIHRLCEVTVPKLLVNMITVIVRLQFITALIYTTMFGLRFAILETLEFRDLEVTAPCIFNRKYPNAIQKPGSSQISGPKGQKSAAVRWTISHYFCFIFH